MSDRYIAWIEAMNKQESMFVVVALGGVALGAAWCLRSFVWMPEPVRRFSERAYLVGGISIWILTILYTVRAL